MTRGRTNLEARTSHGALAEAQANAAGEIGSLVRALDDTSGALRGALEHITTLEQENTKLRRLTAELASIGGRP